MFQNQYDIFGIITECVSDVRWQAQQQCIAAQGDVRPTVTFSRLGDTQPAEPGGFLRTRAERHALLWSGGWLTDFLSMVIAKKCTIVREVKSSVDRNGKEDRQLMFPPVNFVLVRLKSPFCVFYFFKCRALFKWRGGGGGGGSPFLVKLTFP